MKWFCIPSFLLLLLTMGCGISTEEGKTVPESGKSLVVLCGSSMAEPMQKIADQFEKETGISVELSIGGCEVLLPQLELGAPADLFIGHTPFEDLLKEKGLRQEPLVILGEIRPTVVSTTGNPKGIRTLRDLTRDDVKLGLPDSRKSTCGEIFENVAAAEGLLDAVLARRVYAASTHQELATALRAGNVDVVVVWNFIAAMHKDTFEPIDIDVSFNAVDVFACRVVEPEASEDGARLMAFLGTQEALDVFGDMGYEKRTEAVEVTPGEPVVLRMYCAAGLQKPIDELAELFKQRHNDVRFETIYQGSGTLLAQMALNKTGDLYIAGDEVYMQRAAEKGLLLRSARVAVFSPVLVVPTKNLKQITSFADLDGEGVRLGLADENGAALGTVTRKLLERQGLWDAVKGRVVVTAGTVSELAIQASVGSLDAAVIWDATAIQFEDRLTVVDRGDRESQVGVPVGTLKSAEHPALAEAFLELASSAEAKPIFNKHGFAIPEDE